MRRPAVPGVLAAGLAVALAMAGCDAATSSAAGTDASPVVFWDTSGPNESPVFARLAQGCAQQGGYRVTIENVAFEQARDDFEIAAEAGQGPDVLRAEVGWMPELANDTLLADLSDTDAARDTDDFNPLALESARFEGRQYGLPQVIDTLGLYYNRKLLADAGVTPPSTYQELKADAAKLGGDKTFFINNLGYYSLPFLFGSDAELIDSGAKKIVVNSQQAVQGWQLAKNLLDAKAARTSPDATNSYASMQAAFGAGEVAMVVNGPWSYADYTKAAAFRDPANLGVAAVPGATGPGKGPQGGHNYVIRASTKVKASAVTFIQCMSSRSSQVEVAKVLGLVPTRASALDSAEAQSNPAVAAFGPLVRDNTHPRPWIPEGASLLGPLGTAWTDVLAGTKDPKAALDAAAKAYQPLLPGYVIG